MADSYKHCYIESMKRGTSTHRTTIEIDRKAFEQARDELGTRGYRDTVNEALQSVNRRAALRRGAEMIRQGGLDLVTPEDLAELRKPR